MGIPKKTIQNWESEANERNAKDYIIRLIERVVRAEGLDTNIPLDELEETGK